MEMAAWRDHHGLLVNWFDLDLLLLVAVLDTSGFFKPLLG